MGMSSGRSLSIDTAVLSSITRTCNSSAVSVSPRAVTIAPFLGNNVRSPWAWSSRKASRTGVRLMESDSAISPSVISELAASVPEMMASATVA